MPENKIKDMERIILLKRYILVADDYLQNEYIEKLNAFINHPSYDPQTVLELYCSKVRAEAFKEFCGDLNKILYLL